MGIQVNLDECATCAKIKLLNESYASCMFAFLSDAYLLMHENFSIAILKMVVRGREEEYSKLKSHVSTFIKTEEGSIVYISGVPGSGKTYTVSKLLDSQQISHLFLNTVAFKTRKEVYKHILMGLSCESDPREPYLGCLRRHFTTCSMPHIVVIDEIDLLINKKQEILYNIFDMPYLEGSKLLLFLISNTMDLPERLFEPKICSRIGKRRINFVPYTSAQLQSMVVDPRVDKKSVELASKRIGSVSGDARKIVDVVNRAKEHKRDGKIELSDIDTVMKKMYTPLYIYYLQRLTFYQKIILSLTKGVRKSRMSIKAIYEDFTSLCKRTDVDIIGFFEFSDVLELLVEYGIFKYRNSRKEISLMILGEEIERALSNDIEYTGLAGKVGLG